jgi:putative MATE family efflux protein
MSDALAPSRVSAAGPLAERTRALLEAPVAATLVRLAAPTVLVTTIQASVTALDAYYVGRLGPVALAGVSLVFPLVMLMQTMSAGGMGGGVASAVARALGGGRRAEASALAWHALVIAVVMGGAFTLGLVGWGPTLYRALGARGPVAEMAVAYSNVIFGGALAYWLLNTLGSIVRGAGNMVLPAAVMIAGALVYAVLAPALLAGHGPLPALGIRGPAAANLVATGGGALVLLGYLGSSRSLVRLSPRGLRLRWSLFREILRVGAPAALNTVFTNLTVVLLTALVAPFGSLALAGYGIAARLEYLLIPLVFGFGSALVTMVGTNIGAGHRARAERIAWIGAGLAAALTGSVGLGAALAPEWWMRLFTTDAEALAVGATYLRIVGPTYGFFGAGLALYFASQGAGRLFWPLLAGALRLVVAAGAGWLACGAFGAGLPGLFGAIAAALVVFGATNMLAVKAGAWSRGLRSTS